MSSGSDDAAATEMNAANTDRELWRGTDPAGDYYADSVHITLSGRIGIKVGGYVMEKTPREWLDLAWPERGSYVHQDASVSAGERPNE